MVKQKSRILLSGAIEGHLRYVSSAYSVATHRDYAKTHSAFLEFLGDVDFYDIEAADVERFLIHMRETPIELAGVTVGHKLQTVRYRRPKTLLNLWIGLSALWTWGVKRGYAAEHVVRMVPKPRHRPEPIVPLSEVEVVKLMRACELSRAWHNAPLTNNARPTVERDKAIIGLFVETALRVSELCGLKVKDVHFYRGGGRVHVDLGKGGKSRDVPFSKRCAKLLRAYIDTMPGVKEETPLFVNVGRNEGLAMTRGNVLKLVSRLGEKAGVEASPHKLRTTAACLLVKNGCTAWKLKEIMGHEDITTTMRYVTAATLDLDEAMLRASPLDNLRL